MSSMPMQQIVDINCDVETKDYDQPVATWSHSTALVTLQIMLGTETGSDDKDGCEHEPKPNASNQRGKIDN